MSITKELQKTNGGYLGVPYQETFDPFYANLVLGLPMGGPGLTNGSTTFTDCSPTTKTVTASGNAALSSTQYKYYGLSGAFDGNGDGLVVTNHTDLNFGANDFYMGSWFRFVAWNSFNPLFCKYNSGASSYEYYTDVRNSGTQIQANFYYSGATSYSVLLTLPTALSLGTFTHIAFYRVGSVIYIAVNFQVVGTITGATAALTTTTNNVEIASNASDTRWTWAYMNDALMYKGTAAWQVNGPGTARGYLNRARRNAPGIWRL